MGCVNDLKTGLQCAGVGVAMLCAAVLPAQPAVEVPEGETAPAAQVTSKAPLPPQWREADFRFTPARFTVEVATFPSPALAESVRNGLMNMGWRPVYVSQGEDRVRVTLGDFTSLGDARYVAEEFRLTRLAEGRVITREAGKPPAQVSIDGPLLNPYMASPSGMKEPFDWDRERGVLAVQVNQLPLEQQASVNEALEQVSLPGSEEEKARAAMLLIEILRANKSNSAAVLYLAGKVARGDWPAEPGDRLRAGELVADLLYANRQDWRGAWAASRDLLSNPERLPEGRARDHLRRAALMVDLAAGPDEPKPSWNEVRAMLRRAWETVPGDNRREQAKIELFYLQTFAWEGRWDRVEEPAHDMASRYPQDWPETGLAEIFYARSLEVHEDYREAVRVLETVMVTEYSGPSLALGNESLNLHDRARKYWRYFKELQLQDRQ